MWQNDIPTRLGEGGRSNPQGNRAGLRNKRGKLLGDRVATAEGSDIQEFVENRDD